MKSIYLIKNIYPSVNVSEVDNKRDLYTCWLKIGNLFLFVEKLMPSMVLYKENMKVFDKYIGITIDYFRPNDGLINAETGEKTQLTQSEFNMMVRIKPISKN